MMSSEESEFQSLPPWFKRMVPFVSIILSILVFSYVWFRYNQLSTILLENWIRFIIIGVIGVVFLFSALVFFLNKEGGWKWFIAGFALLPVLLFFQLILFAIRAVQTLSGFVLEGSIPKPLQMFIENYPSKFDVVILAVLLIIGVSWIIKKLKN